MVCRDQRRQRRHRRARALAIRRIVADGRRVLIPGREPVVDVIGVTGVGDLERAIAGIAGRAEVVAGHFEQIAPRRLTGRNRPVERPASEAVHRQARRPGDRLIRRPAILGHRQVHRRTGHPARRLRQFDRADHRLVVIARCHRHQIQLNPHPARRGHREGLGRRLVRRTRRGEHIVARLHRRTLQFDVELPLVRPRQEPFGEVQPDRVSPIRHRKGVAQRSTHTPVGV